MPRSLTEGSIPIGLYRFALPILFANILQSLNGSVNSIWVGRYLGEAALTATSNANTVMFLLIGAAFGVALAATILIGQSIGANDIAETKRVIGTSATFFAAISVAMAVAGLILCRPLLIAMSTPADSLPLAVAYMRVIFLARAVSLYVRLRDGGAARRGRLEDAVLFHAAVGRDRHRAQPGAHLRRGSHPATRHRRLGARDLHRPDGEPRGADPPPLPPPAPALPAQARSCAICASTGRWSRRW